MKFTILIVTYKPVWTKLQVTLESVMRQTFKDYEIVISDDGSEDNCFDKIEAYFKEKRFDRYTLVSHEKNQGTVKNLIAGLEQSQGQYIRDFGPGDAFYNEHTLQRLCDFMDETQCEGCFGLMRGYHFDNQKKLFVENFYHPFDIVAYKRKNNKRIQKNLVLYRDNASGAGTCYTKAYYMEYLKRLEGEVLLTEDIFQLLAGLDNRPLEVFQEYMVWYEITIKESTLTHISEVEFEKDIEAFYDKLQREYPDNINVKKQKRVNGLYRIRNLYRRTLVRFFVNPDAIRYVVSHWIQIKTNQYQPEHPEKGFMDTNEFISLAQGE